MKLICSLCVIIIVAGCGENNSTENRASMQDSVRPASTKWIGEWERKAWQNNGDIEITAVRADSILFTMSAASGANSGYIEEAAAVVKDNIATYISNQAYDSCTIIFKLVGDTMITVEQKGGPCLAGAGVSWNGNYLNKKLVKNESREDDLVSLDVLSKQEDSVLRSLSGKTYTSFVNATQLVQEGEDLDSVDAKVIQSFVRGVANSMNYIIMTNKAGNLWAATIDDEKIFYFTNREEHKNKLPKTIEEWRKNFDKYEVVYQQ